MPAAPSRPVRRRHPIHQLLNACLLHLMPRVTPLQPGDFMEEGFDSLNPELAGKR
jgi:hypothetical protein